MSSTRALWADYAARCATAQAVFPWSDVGQFAIVDRSRAPHVGLDALRPTRSGDFSTAPRASHSGDAIIVWTSGDGGWKVLVRQHIRRPTDLPPGQSMLCRLHAPTGELVIHDSGTAFSLHEWGPDDAYHPLKGERVIATVAPGSYLVQVTMPTFVDFDDDAPDESRAPDYLVDLWPEVPGDPVSLTWSRLG